MKATTSFKLKYLRHCTLFGVKLPVHDLVLVIPLLLLSKLLAIEDRAQDFKWRGGRG